MITFFAGDLVITIPFLHPIQVRRGVDTLLEPAKLLNDSNTASDRKYVFWRSNKNPWVGYQISPPLLPHTPNQGVANR